jgi:acetylornithine/succinyldiaminopimelate/putrescine aminotransferase
MKKKKDLLTDKQFQINQRSVADTQAAKEWLEQTGFNSNTFGTTHIRLLQAQQQAHALLTHHSNLLNHSQRTMLENFQQLMQNKRTRDRLKPTAANPILNISSKINRQLFKQHRQLTQA